MSYLSTVEQAVDDIWNISDEQAVPISKIGYTGIPDKTGVYQISIQTEQSLDERKSVVLKESLKRNLTDELTVQKITDTESDITLTVGV